MYKEVKHNLSKTTETEATKKKKLVIFKQLNERLFQLSFPLKTKRTKKVFFSSFYFPSDFIDNKMLLDFIGGMENTQSNSLRLVSYGKVVLES